MITDELRQRRLDVIDEHFRSEVDKEFDRTLATFNGHPRYEIMATGQVFDGDDEVLTYHRTQRTAFPDQRHDNVRMHVADDAVITEFDLLGTTSGSSMACPPPARRSACR
jgi:predicted ester cyclase